MNKYPFTEGQTYYTLDHLNQPLESVWDEASEHYYDALDPEDRANSYYASRDQAYFVALWLLADNMLCELFNEESPFHNHFQHRLRDITGSYYEKQNLTTLCSTPEH